MVLCVLGFLGLWVLAFKRSRCLVFRLSRVFGVLGFWDCAILGFYGLALWHCVVWVFGVSDVLKVLAFRCYGVFGLLLTRVFSVFCVLAFSHSRVSGFWLTCVLTSKS